MKYNIYFTSIYTFMDLNECINKYGMTRTLDNFKILNVIQKCNKISIIIADFKYDIESTKNRMITWLTSHGSVLSHDIK